MDLIDINLRRVAWLDHSTVLHEEPSREEEDNCQKKIVSYGRQNSLRSKYGELL